MKKLILLVLFLLLLVSDNKASGQSQHKVFLPVVVQEQRTVPVHWHVAWFSQRYRYEDYHHLIEKFTRAFPFEQERSFWQDKEFVPAVKCNQLQDWIDNYRTVMHIYDGEVFVLNEPQLWGQGCHMTPYEAYQFVVEFRNLCPNCYIVAPNMSQLNGYVQWMNEFMSYNPPLDALAYHYYGWICCTDPTEQLEFYASFGYPIYITEWGAIDPQKAEFLLDLWSDEPLVVETYYFAPYIPCDYQGIDSWNCESTLFEDNGDITEIGFRVHYNFLP